MGTLSQTKIKIGEYARGYAREVPDGTVAIEDYASLIDIPCIQMYI